MQEQTTLPIGSTVGVRDAFEDGYRVKKLLGKGGFGAIYLVSERRDKKRVFALKEVVEPSRQDRKRLLLEFELLKRLNHPALPRVYHVLEQEEFKRIYLLMEYIRGKDLETLRKEQPGERFPVKQVLTILDPIIDALTYLHHQEPPILHRDIKPGNIILSLDATTATLVDFGTAKEYLPENTTTIFRYGTPGYAAIEQYSPESTTGIRTDVYGLGATLYRLLTGEKPTDAVKRFTTEKGSDTLQPANVLVPGIPQPVSQAIHRALSMHYEDRFPTVKEFWRVLHTDSGEQEKQVPALRLQINPDTPRPPLLEEDEEEEGVDINRLAPSPGKQEDIPFRRRKRIALFSLALALLAYVGQSLSNRRRKRIALFSLAPLALIVLGLGLLFYFTRPATPTVSPSTSSKTVTTFPYPPIASSYAGTITDIAVANETTKLYLGQMRQDQNSFSGIFQGLGLVGSFTGTVTSSGKVHFIVKYGAGSLIFDGQIKVGGDLGGNFYTVDQQGQSLSEYGLWYASATSS